MKVKIVMIGKTDENWVQLGIEKYSKRLQHYIKIEWVEIPDLKGISKMSIEEQKNRQTQKLEEQLKDSDFIVLLDEKGKEHTSKDFSSFLQKRMNAGTRKLSFVIGGPFGFSEEIKSKCQAKMALSQMTFSHQMIRPFFVEQIYRAMTILNGEKYHHD